MNGQVLSGFPKAPPGHGAVALGLAEVPHQAIAGLKRSLGPPGGAPFAPNFLKASEEQTVVGLAAVARAAGTLGLHGEAMADWGVIAAPRSLARLAAADGLRRFEQGGVWKVSPFLVPHHSLHSVSGTISQAFRMYGPNFGVGGTADAVIEGLLSALALLDGSRLAGLWLVLSECDPEPVPDPEGVSTNAVTYRALALGFRPAAAGRELVRLRLSADHRQAAPAQPPTVAELAGFLGAATRPDHWSCGLGWGRLEVTRLPGAAEALSRSVAPTRQVA